jgi:hypothetical protein
MHSDAKPNQEFPFGHNSFYTKGGLNEFIPKEKHTLGEGPYFIKDKNVSNILNDLCYKNREGWYGWYGFGGSIFQWHPELKIGFAYVTCNVMNFDFVNYRGSII